MHYLSRVVGRPVRDGQGEPIGKVDDLIVAVGDRYPPVTGLVILAARRRIFLPWTAVESLDEHGVMLHTRTIDIGVFQQRPNEILLRKDLLDRQIVDIDGRRVVRVNDLRLDEVGGALHLVAVDVGAAGLVRRFGLRAPVPDDRARPPPARRRSATSTGRTWTRSSRRSRRSSCACPTRDSPTSIPSDLADILDQLAPPDRAGVLASLADEAVADAMEEMEPEAQVEVIEDLEPARAADILEEMSPDDAADLVADLDQDTRDEILAHMERDEAEEVQELLGYPEDSAGGIMTTAVHRPRRAPDRRRGHRPAAAAGAGRRDHLLRLRDRRRRPPRGRALAARPHRGAPGDAHRGRDEPTSRSR